jgi:GT2 family glycosyltransferase
MKIAAIVITFNDGYKFKEWLDHHRIYRDELYLHIIVDNGSDPAYVKMVEESFPDSVVIKRTSNGGCTGAYNDGIKRALSDPAVDAIMLIGNDIRLENGGVSGLHSFLMSDKAYGMIAPVLLAKDSTLIDDYGCNITKTLYMDPFDVRKDIEAVDVAFREIDSVTGGMNMAKREFYEHVGLQDELLFMYSDEVDMGIRARKAGYKMAVTKLVRSWHQHINPAQRTARMPYSSFLIGRNKVYLAWKHFGLAKALYVFWAQAKKFALGMAYSIVKQKELKHQLFFIWGACKGLMKDMRLPDGIINNQ